MPAKDDGYDFLVMLEEAQNYFNAQIRSFDAFRDHGKTVLGASSVVVSLFAIFGTVDTLKQDSFYYVLIIIAIAILYGWLMFNSLLASIPKTFHYPIMATEQEYAKAFLGKNKKDIIKQRLANYLDIIQKNEVFIKQRREMMAFITLQLTIVVIFILIASLLPLLL